MNGDVEIAVDDERERARYRRRGHDEHMRLLPLADERRALCHAEAVLLVRDDEAETGVFNVGAEERVGADDEVDAPRRQAPPLPRVSPFARHCTGEPRNAQSEGARKAN